MNRIIGSRSLWLSLTLAFVAGGVGVGPAQAQDGEAGQRITIMVPDLAPLAGASDRFGERVAEELRERIEEMHPHQTVSGRELRDARREYGLSRDELYNCSTSRQLAMRMGWGLVVCGEYERIGNGQVRVEAKFVGADDGAEFEVPEFTAPERNTDQAAQVVLETFDQWQTQLPHMVSCQEHMDSQSWDRALENCDIALEIMQGTAPAGPAMDSAAVRDYYSQAAESYQRVFEEQGSETEPQILERLTIALFKLGQMDQAVAMGERAVELDPENAALWDAYARALQEAGQPREALAALERTHELAEPSAGRTQRTALLQLELGNEDRAVQTLVVAVEDGLLEATGAFNTIFGNAYNEKFRNGRLDEAYTLLEAAGPLAVTEKDRLMRNFWRGYILFEQAKAAHEPLTAASAQRAKPLFEQALELFQASQGYEQYHASANVAELIDNAQQFIQIEEALIRRGR